MYRRLLVLALGTFAVGTDSFVIAGLLPGISRSLHVSTAPAEMGAHWRRCCWWGAAATVGNLGAGHLGDRFGSHRVAVVALVVAAADFVLLPWTARTCPARWRRWWCGVWRAGAGWSHSSIAW
jgi:predicted MFS family arabinose efflux permease